MSISKLLKFLCIMEKNEWNSSMGCCCSKFETVCKCCNRALYRSKSIFPDHFGGPRIFLFSWPNDFLAKVSGMNLLEIMSALLFQQIT